MAVLADQRFVVRGDGPTARRRIWLCLAIALVVLGLFGSTIDASHPTASAVGFYVLAALTLTSLLKPVAGLYLTVFFTLVGDSATAPWWPYTKNLSSRESLLYLGDGLSLSPLEVVLAATAFGLVLCKISQPAWRFRRGVLLTPVLVFTGFVLLGFAYGAVTGGDRRVALFEMRPLLYIGMIYVLVTNLLTTRRQYRALLWLSLTGVVVQSWLSIHYYLDLPPGLRADVESLSQHSATVHIAMLVTTTVAALLFRTERWRRALLLVMLPLPVLAFVISQRRAGMIALAGGIVAVAIFVYQRRPMAFWLAMPPTAVVFVGWVLATWNTPGAAGLGAQATKSVLFPNQVSEADRSSDIYRQIEAFNLWSTIRSEPLTGVGFGRPFYMPRALPDISFFEFWQYIPHNSIVWIWLKMGFFGMVAMLSLMALAVASGARSAMQVRPNWDLVCVLAGLCFIIMFLVFAYVDIAWDGRCTVFLGVAFALCGDYVLAATPVRRPVRHRAADTYCGLEPFGPPRRQQIRASA